MNKSGMKISYDKRSGVLAIEVKGGKSVDSDIRGNVVIDYDKKGEIVRVNFYDFNLGVFQESRKALKQFTHKFATSAAK